ncbi:MAG: GNAT family protein [Gemmataceae bacterium]
MTSQIQVERPAGGGETPRLEGRTLRLRPIVPADYGPLRQAELGAALGPRWRFRGATPTLEEWVHKSGDRVLAQFLVVSKPEQTPLGAVHLFNPNFQDGHAQLSVARLEAETRAPKVMLGLGLLIRYAFHCWPLRKLYMEVAEFNYPQFESGAGRFFEVEGRYRQHLYLGGRYWDQLVLAITREAWLTRGARHLALEVDDG